VLLAATKKHIDDRLTNGFNSKTNKNLKSYNFKSMQKKKVLVFLAKAFETMEFCVFIDVLGWARVDYGHNIFVDTCGFTDKVTSTFNVTVIVDKTIGEINVDEYDALAIPGGFGEFGYYEEAYDERFLKLIREFDAKGKIIATVCSGAFPLGKSGIIKNRKATTYHLKNGYWQEKLKEFGVNVVNEPVVIDGNIITSYCPETAPKVAFELLKMLTTEDDVAIIKKAMGF
jgi:4-methyl-5(b-hydroxyethyl)-thiazole monophosphate biosynthesis